MPSATHQGGPILIVGAGPAGLTLAAVLSQFGVPFRLIDRLEAPLTWSRAVVVHARTLELLHALGLREQFEKAGVRLYSAGLEAGGRRLASLSFDELDAPFPYVLSIPQRDSESILAGSIGLESGAVERGSELVDVAPEDEQVTAWIRRKDGTMEVMRCAWVIGCDGRESVVRTLGHLGAGPERAPQQFWLADLDVPRGAEPDQITTAFAEEGVVGVIPLPGGRHRLIAGVAADDPRTPSLDLLRSIVAERGLTRLELDAPQWMGKLVVRPHKAPRLRSGRVFLAGDAAHVHDPIGGLGMNLAIQEAFNLGWKLSLVALGRVRAHVLESYDTERMPIAESFDRSASWAIRAATMRHPIARTVRDRVAAYLSSLEVVQQRMLRNLAMFSSGYRGSSIVREWPPIKGEIPPPERAGSDLMTADFARGPRAGDLAPDAPIKLEGHAAGSTLRRTLGGMKHSLLLFGGRGEDAALLRDLEAIAHAARTRANGLIDVYPMITGSERPAGWAWPGPVLLDTEGSAAYRYGASHPCIYLIRPDGYVAFRSQPMDGFELLDYISTIFL